MITNGRNPEPPDWHSDTEWETATTYECIHQIEGSNLVHILNKCLRNIPLHIGNFLRDKPDIIVILWSQAIENSNGIAAAISLEFSIALASQNKFLPLLLHTISNYKDHRVSSNTWEMQQEWNRYTLHLQDMQCMALLKFPSNWNNSLACICIEKDPQNPIIACRYWLDKLHRFLLRRWPYMIQQDKVDIWKSLAHPWSTLDHKVCMPVGPYGRYNIPLGKEHIETSLICNVLLYTLHMIRSNMLLWLYLKIDRKWSIHDLPNSCQLSI